MEGKELVCVNCRQYLNVSDSAETRDICTDKSTREKDKSNHDKRNSNKEEGQEETGDGEAGNRTINRGEGAESRVDVKCLSYHEVNQLLAVAFEG